jgi:glycosyltransferase involved in cell wall biosynthesis
MEVCIVSAFFYPYQGGIETQLYEMIKKLYENKVYVKVLSLIPKEDLGRLKEFPYADCVPINAKRVFIPKFSPPPLAFFSPFEIMNKFEKDCSDMKIVHSFNELVGSCIHRKLKNNIFIHSQHNAVKDGTSFILWKTICNLSNDIVLKKYLKRCDNIVSISRHIAKELELYYKINDVKVIPNGLNIDKFKFSKKDAEEFRNDNGIDKFFIFSTGRLVKEKGFQQLIRAVAEMNNKDVVLGIGGEGYYKEELIKLSRELDIDAKFFGFMNEKNWMKAFCACDIFVTPSLFKEPFGLVNIEAMSFERPVIASSVGGIPEIVDDNITGLLYNPYDYKELAKKLEILYNDKRLRLNFGKNGRKKVERKYSWDVLVKEWIEFYKTLI